MIVISHYRVFHILIFDTIYRYLLRCPGPYGLHVNLNIISIIVVLVVCIIHQATATPQRYISARNMHFFSLNMDVRLGNVRNSRTEQTGIVKTISPKLYTTRCYVYETTSTESYCSVRVNYFSLIHLSRRIV